MRWQSAYRPWAGEECRGHFTKLTKTDLLGLEAWAKNPRRMCWMRLSSKQLPLERLIFGLGIRSSERDRAFLAEHFWLDGSL